MSLEVGIIEFGSKNITVMIARRGINGTFDVKGISKVEYAGYYDGEWLEAEGLRFKIKEAISAAENNARIKIKDMFVGVPGEFTTVVAKNVSMSFKTKQKITPFDVEQLYETGDSFRHDPEFIVINRSAIYYVLDDNQRLIDPVGMTSSKMSGKLSYILAERRFLKKISHFLSDYDFKTEYISSILAEGLFLFEPDVRDRYVLMCDVGYITTSVALFRGDGLLFMKSFSMGGGHIEMDLAECLHIPFEIAVRLKGQVALSLDVSENDKYDVSTKDGYISFSARMVHDVVSARIENMAQIMLKCLEDCPVNCPKQMPIYLTGGGISYMRGAKDLLSRCLMRPVDRYERGLPQYNKPHELAEYGLLDIALKNVEPKKSFLKKIFNN